MICNQSHSQDASSCRLDWYRQSKHIQQHLSSYFFPERCKFNSLSNFGREHLSRLWLQLLRPTFANQNVVLRERVESVAYPKKLGCWTNFIGVLFKWENTTRKITWNFRRHKPLGPPKLQKQPGGWVPWVGSDISKSHTQIFQNQKKMH